MSLINRVFVLLALCCAAMVPCVAQAQNYSDIWWNPSESGWGLTLADHDTQLFGVWYAYAANGDSTWYVIPGGKFTQGKRFFSGDIYQTVGPAFDTTFDSSLVVGTKVGTANFDFSPPGIAAGTASFSYTIGSLSQTKQIQRQSFGNAAPSWGVDYTDLWWKSAESGWGLTLAQHGNNVFGVWFTYDSFGDPLWVVLPGVTFNGDNSFSGTLYITTGPYYADIPFNPANVVITPVGTASVTFNGRNGTFTTTLDGYTQTKSITSQPFGNPPPTGESLLTITVVPPGLFDIFAGQAIDPPLRVVTATGGNPPYHFQLDSLVYGAPPIGTNVDINGFLIGKPTTSNVTQYAFSVCVADIGGHSRCLHQNTGSVAALVNVDVKPLTPTQNGTIAWTIGDQCNNGAEIDYKFYDRANSLVWPSSSTHYLINYSQTASRSLSCVPDSKVCIGAQSGSLQWGVDLNGGSSCPDCCGTCDGRTYAYTFGCNSPKPPPSGTSYYANWSCGSSSQCASDMGGSAGSKGPFCSLSSCQAWGNQNIQFGYSCSTQLTHTPDPGGTQCIQ
jgi:hypothetical protein